MAANLVITPKKGFNRKNLGGHQYHTIATIGLYNKQFRRHIGFKKMLNLVYCRLDDIYFLSKWRPV